MHTSQRMRYLAVLACPAILIALSVTGCGGGSKAASTSSKSVSTAAAPPQPSGIELRYDKAALDRARLLYASQEIKSVECHKTGFTSMGDTMSCTLTAGDGTVTEPSDWQFIKSQSAGGSDYAQLRDGTSSNPAPSTGNGYDGSSGSYDDGSSGSYDDGSSGSYDDGSGTCVDDGSC